MEDFTSAQLRTLKRVLLLPFLISVTGMRQLDPKGIDGKIARLPAKSNTVAAIAAFQSRSRLAITELIEPASETWTKLLVAAGEVMP